MDFTVAQLTRLQLKTCVTKQECRTALLQATSWEEALRYLVAHLEQSRPPEPLINTGSVFSYIHDNQRTGVLLELRCVSEAGACSTPFRGFAQRLVRQIALTGPRYVDTLAMPVVERRVIIHHVLKNVSTTHLPEEDRETFLRAKIDEKLAEQVLLMQKWREDPTLSIEDLLGLAITEIGEKIVVSRFIHFSLDE